jgi:hypothetical protein
MLFPDYSLPSVFRFSYHFLLQPIPRHFEFQAIMFSMPGTVHDALMIRFKILQNDLSYNSWLSSDIPPMVQPARPTLFAQFWTVSSPVLLDRIGPPVICHDLLPLWPFPDLESVRVVHGFCSLGWHCWKNMDSHTCR